MMKNITALLALALSASAVGCAVDTAEGTADAADAIEQRSDRELALADWSLRLADNDFDECDKRFLRALVGDRALATEGCEKSFIADVIEIGAPGAEKALVHLDTADFDNIEEEWLALGMHLGANGETTPAQDDMLEQAEELRAARVAKAGHGAIGYAEQNRLQHGAKDSIGTPEQVHAGDYETIEQPDLKKLEAGGQGIGNAPKTLRTGYDSDRVVDKTNDMAHQ